MDPKNNKLQRLLGGLFLLLCLDGQANERPNIVFILSDNQSAEALSVYGNRDVDMPHMEALAARGLRFDQAFAVSGMCSPTRATLLTGLIPSQHGLHNALHDKWVNQQPGWSAIAEFDSLPQALQRGGYQTAMIGKWHIGDPKTAAPGFDHWVALPYGHTRDFWHNQLMVNGKLDEIEGRHIVDVLADYAAAYLTNVDDSAPFFLQLSLDGPYALPPTNYGAAQNRFYPVYSNKVFESMPVEPVNDNILQRITGPFVPGHAIENGIDDMNLDEIWNSLLYRTIRMQGHRESYANFLSQNAVVDAAVGTVWQALEQRGLESNTIVIYSADQGNLFGQHGSWGHTNWFWPSHLFDAAMRIPLIVYQPGDMVAGQVSTRLIAQYDLAATIADMAGVEVEFENSPGQSFYPVMTPSLAESTAPTAVFFEQEESRGIRTSQYAYWKRAQGMGEPALYDIGSDPEQRVNIYPRMAGSELVQNLDRQLEAFFIRYSDPTYNLWMGGVPKGTTPNPLPWLKQNPWPWMKKLWGDYWQAH